jgi:hypothetical protein
VCVCVCVCVFVCVRMYIISLRQRSGGGILSFLGFGGGEVIS